MNITVIALLLGLMGSVIAGYVGYGLGEDHMKATEADKKALVAEAVDAANNVSAVAISKLTPRQTIIRQTLEKEIHENRVYADCKSSDDSVRAFNSGFQADTARPPSDSQLPKPDASK